MSKSGLELDEHQPYVIVVWDNLILHTTIARFWKYNSESLAPDNTVGQIWEYGLIVSPVPNPFPCVLADLRIKWIESEH